MSALKGIIFGMVLTAGIFGGAMMGGPAACSTLVDAAEAAEGVVARKAVRGE